MNIIDHLLSAYRNHTDDLYGVLSYILEQPDVFAMKYRDMDFGFPDDAVFYLVQSGSDLVVVMVDPGGAEEELIDEEPFGGERPMWFTDSTHRTSPFYDALLMTEAVKRSMPAREAASTRFLAVLVSDTHTVNFQDYEEFFPANGGVVFTGIDNIIDFEDIPCHMAPGRGDDITVRFLKATDDRETLFRLIEGYPAVEPDIEDGDRRVPRNFEGRDALAVEILPPVDNPGSELADLVGMGPLKEHVSNVMAYARFHTRIKAQCPAARLPALNLHAIVVGSPGTGKTTFCRLYGSLLREAGVLDVGHTVVSGRATFVGEHFGHEERRVESALRLAQRGVLFIDEAGDLISHPHPHDPGRTVLNNMLQILADESRRNIAVVLALYDERSLEALYRLNPGFRSRFPNVFRLPDYNLAELTQILRLKARNMGVTFTPGAWQRLCRHLSESSAAAGFANGRAVTNLLQECLMLHAIRCERQGVSGPGLLRLTAADVPDPSPSAAAPRLGFR